MCVCLTSDFLFCFLSLLHFVFICIYIISLFLSGLAVLFAFFLCYGFFFSSSNDYFLSTFLPVFCFFFLFLIFFFFVGYSFVLLSVPFSSVFHFVFLFCCSSSVFSSVSSLPLFCFAFSSPFLFFSIYFLHFFFRSAASVFLFFLLADHRAVAYLTQVRNHVMLAWTGLQQQINK